MKRGAKVLRRPPKWYAIGTSSPSMKAALSPGDEPRRMRSPPLKALRAAPGRFRTALRVSPWVPATAATSSAGITCFVISRRTRSPRTTETFQPIVPGGGADEDEARGGHLERVPALVVRRRAGERRGAVLGSGGDGGVRE